MSWTNGGWDDGYIPDGAELAEAAEGQWPYVDHAYEDARAAHEGMEEAIEVSAPETPALREVCLIHDVKNNEWYSSEGWKSGPESASAVTSSLARAIGLASPKGLRELRLVTFVEKPF